MQKMNGFESHSTSVADETKIDEQKARSRR